MIRFSHPWVLTTAIASLALAGVGLWKCAPCCMKSGTPLVAAPEYQLVADIVEVRNASVFAGACHYNGELTTQGGEALLAIAVESGSSQGVDLGGVQAAALVSSEKNLKFTGTPRRSIVYVDAAASEAQRTAIVALLRERTHGELGQIVAIEAAKVRVTSAGESFDVEVAGRTQLRGMPMPDRACCKMPNQVWYEPLLPLKQRVVGFTQSWSVKEPRLGLSFERAEENSAFVGRLSFFDGGCAASSEPVHSSQP